MDASRAGEQRSPSPVILRSCRNGPFSLPPLDRGLAGVPVVVEDVQLHLPGEDVIEGFEDVPVFDESVLVYPNLHGRLFALRGKTGELIWEWPVFTKPPKPTTQGPQNPSPLVIDDETLIWMRGRTVALDVATGKEKWSNEFSGHAMRAWRYEERTCVIGHSPKGVHCIDAEDGRTVWTHEAVLGFSQGLPPLPTTGSPWSHRSCRAGFSCGGEMEFTVTI